VALIFTFASQVGKSRFSPKLVWIYDARFHSPRSSSTGVLRWLQRGVRR